MSDKSLSIPDLVEKDVRKLGRERRGEEKRRPQLFSIRGMRIL